MVLLCELVTTRKSNEKNNEEMSSGVAVYGLVSEGKKKKKEEKGEKRDKVLECRDELSAGRRRRLSRRLYLTKLSTEEERRALLQPGKLYRGSEVPGGRGASFRKLAGRRKREVTS